MRIRIPEGKTNAAPYGFGSKKVKTVNLLAKGDVWPVLLLLCGPSAVHLLVGRLLRRLLSLLRLPLLLRVLNQKYYYNRYR